MAPNHEYRIQRGRILKMLYKVYDTGESLSDKIIALTLGDIHLKTSQPTVRGHIHYLLDRGLITVEELGKYEVDLKYWARLTYRGVDFVENDKSDDGIDMGV